MEARDSLEQLKKGKNQTPLAMATSKVTSVTVISSQLSCSNSMSVTVTLIMIKFNKLNISVLIKQLNII